MKTTRRRFRNPKDPGKRTLEIFQQELGRVRLLTHEEEFDLAYRVDKGDEEAKQKLITANLPLVIHIARSVNSQYKAGNPAGSLNGGQDFGDLIQAGTVGLSHAVKNFDWRKGYRFSTYAWLWIWGAIWQAFRTKSKFAISIDSDGTDGDEEKKENPYETIPDPCGVDPYRIVSEEPAFDSLLNEQLRRAFKILTTEEMRILELSFGLGNSPPLSSKKIGHELGIPAKRVKEIQEEAIGKLQRHMGLEGQA